MGDKLEAKKIAVACGVPVIPGTREPLKDADEALAKAKEFGFPVILKAAAGGGGRGMRLCEKPEDVAPAFELVSNEARKAFGDDSIFMEKYLVEPKHIEVQILADEHGCVRHLGERDCSLQRRYQKVVEFAPAWSVAPEVREKLHADAVKIAEAVHYVNAGTVEFLVDKSGNHYFIEMNPRIQVEHTVTEMVTGIDVVRAQILIAGGAPLALGISEPSTGSDVAGMQTSYAWTATPRSSTAASTTPPAAWKLRPSSSSQRIRRLTTSIAVRRCSWSIATPPA